MIIKVIPETDAEKQRMQEVEHKGVRDFLMFGNKRDENYNLIDFHDWSGSYRYLEGSLYYFLTNITEEKQMKFRRSEDKTSAAGRYPFIKTGEVNDQKVNVIDASGLIKNESADNIGIVSSDPNVIPFPSIDAQDVQDVVKNDDTKDNG
jgi:hypothetical protein